jgi:glucose/arabinose dehydrogenase
MVRRKADPSWMRSFLASLVLAGSLTAAPAGAQLLQLLTDDVDGPIYLTHAGDERLFILERDGAIRIFTGGAVLPTPFLDITAKVDADGEGGLLGLAFDPDYAANGAFYVSYTTDDPTDGFSSRLSRFHVSGGDANVADPAEDVLFQVEQPFTNHNGGAIQFGPDGMLYFGFGDGGDRDDPGCRAQRDETLLGKMLRIDPDPTGTTEPFYTIPPDNPFVSGADGIRDEILDFGLRNPWRFSFDRDTGDLWIGDVGQDAVEEVDLRPAWGMSPPGTVNWGWKVVEGNSCTNLSLSTCPGGVPACNSPEYTGPVNTYPHTANNRSITGGYVYRGVQAPGFAGNYVFGDFASGRIFALREVAPDTWQRTTLLDSGLGNQWASFGEGPDGELYVMDLARGIFRIDLTAALSNADRKCILGLNDQFAKIAKKRAAQLAKCLANGAAGKLTGTIEACVAAADAKVDKAVAKATAFAADKCALVPPFGPTDATAVADGAKAGEAALQHAVLGADLDLAIVLRSADMDAATCQGKVVAQLSRCHARRVKEFDRCKEAGLRDGSVKSAATLADCLDADPNGKVAASCDDATGGLATKVVPKACTAKAVNLATAFPGCAEADGALFAACAERAGRCAACSALSQADALGADCDDYDDGAANASCP